MPHYLILYEQDNRTLFDRLSIGLAHYAYMNVLARFKMNRNVRGALLSLKAEFAGKAVW